MKQYTRELNNARYVMIVDDDNNKIYRIDEKENRVLVQMFKNDDLSADNDNAYQLYLDQVADYVEEQYENIDVNG